MALLKIDNRWINPAHVMVLRDQGNATEVYLVDPNHQGLHRADFSIFKPINEVGKLFNDFIKDHRLADMAFLKVRHHSERTLWINSVHVSRLELATHVANSTAIFLADPTNPSIVPAEDLVIHLPLDELAKAFNDAIKENEG